MAGVRRVLAWAAAAAVGVPLLAAGAAWGWLRWQVPAPGGDAALPGLERPVTVTRDADGIPYIRAASAHDAYAALGYVHAQDRLWQMEMARRAGAGRLSEALGGQPFLLRTDRLMRTLGLYRRAEASLAALSPDTRAALDAYAAGVNAYLTRRREALPVEFQLLRLTPEPWRAADSVVWAKVMALRLSTNYRSEIHHARLLARLPPDRVRELFPPPRPGSPATLAAAEGAALDAIGPERLAALAAALPPEPPGLGLASNEWVLDGRHTTTGKPILANDPHLELEAPILWYLARIDAPGLSLSGATAPGMPFHLLGHNGRLAWGFTMTYSDTQDLFVERVDPADPSRYLTPGGSAPFATRTETIAVSGGPPETLTVRETRHGPVLSDLEGGDLAAAGPAGSHVLALAFTGLGEADTSVEALHRLNYAGTGAEVRAALALHQSPQQNVAYATTGGTIGLIAPGWVPVRRQGDGRLPVPGWTGEYDWTGMIPFDELPQAENPPSGRLVNANNAVVGPGYPHLIAAEWPEPLRARRIAAMLDGGGPFTLDDVSAQQMDIQSTAAGDLLPLMLAVVPASPRAERAVALLKGWDHRMDRTRPEPLIFAAWQRELSHTLFADGLGPLLSEGLWQSARLVQDALTTSPHWCGPATDACAAALSASLERALDGLAARHGGDPAGWRWGDAHRAVLSHRLLSLIPGVARWFDLSIASDGGNDTVNRGSHTLSNAAAPFAQVHGAGLRAVYDLSDLDRSRFIIATGQSGNPLSPHWGNMVHRWRDGGFVEMPPQPTPAARLTLHPRPTPAGPSS